MKTHSQVAQAFQLKYFKRPPSSAAIIGKSNLQVKAVTVTNITTYYLSLGDIITTKKVIPTSSSCRSLTWHWLTSIEHYVSITNNSYVLVLLMPAFNHSLQHNPFLGLGVLLSNGDGRNNNGNWNTSGNCHSSGGASASHYKKRSRRKNLKNCKAFWSNKCCARMPEFPN